MKKLLIVAVALLFVVSTANAADFAPSLLKLSAEPIVQYDFDGSDLNIPVVVTGASAGIILSVYTKGAAADIVGVTNGFMGWHYVNKLDTCVYYSTLQSVTSGAQVVTWDGKDQDEVLVPSGEYTYCLWAFDNQGPKTLAGQDVNPNRGWYLWEEDEDGLPLDRPILYRSTRRWYIGSDPLDETLLARTSIATKEGWALVGGHCSALQPDDHEMFYSIIRNDTMHQGGICKYKWVPEGDAEIQTEWGDDGGYSELVTMPKYYTPGVTTDGEYLFTGQSDHVQPIASMDIFIYDMDGYLLDEYDISPLMSSPEEYALGGQMNGGTNTSWERDGYVFLNSHCSCHVTMIDPAGYMVSGEKDDMVSWHNDNGDYVLDHNFEDTAMMKWVCNDYNVAPYKYTISADANLFSIVCANGMGAVTFGLCAPDGTGLGYFAFSAETDGSKSGIVFCDGDTPMDGLYLDDKQSVTIVGESEVADPNLFFLGHDTISGVITTATGVAEAAPAAFSVAQNAPNPFNPTTTISFNLVDAGNVSIEVYNVAGQNVDTIVDGFMDAGSHSVVWDASAFSAGVYFYTVKSGGLSSTMKMTLLK